MSQKWNENKKNKDEKDENDKYVGFKNYEKEGWLLNMQPGSSKDGLDIEKASLELFFIQDDATSFRVWLPYNPYFYIYVKEGHHSEVESYLKSTYEKDIAGIDIMDKEDLDLENHLSGLKRKYLKIRFHNVSTLLSVRNDLFPIIKRNKQKSNTSEAYEDEALNKILNTYYNKGNNNFSSNSNNSSQNNLKELNKDDNNSNNNNKSSKQATEYILDIREYDVPYYVRAAIDLNIRVGLWYTVIKNGRLTTVNELTTRVDRPDPKVLAYDIETTKLPLKFPDASIDSIMMISYMLDKQGYLIVNREIVSEDIKDFEYTPKPEYYGPFTVFNEPDEKSVLEKFFSEIKREKPHIFVSYNGDMFDWPFVESRAEYHGLNMFHQIGFRNDNGEYRSKINPHMDAFCWVKRDSYLPHGSHGLKAVTREKLRYDPLELDPELMLKSAQEDPETLANYSVSDAVATYYLYMNYVHPFIFSLCTIIPMNPDDVLRKGSGTLCEALLMTQAFKANVIFPNKHKDDINSMYKGHLLESETYVGGHVECLESGVFRSDIPTNFSLDPAAIEKHMGNIDQVLKFALKEGGIPLDTVSNYQEVKEDVLKKFTSLKENPKQQSHPLIYHLDVSAMYPNIILTNKLQPTAVVNDEICATCIYNKPESQCQRTLDWQWRGDYSPSNQSEYRLILQQLESEKFGDGEERKSFLSLSEEKRNELLRKRLKEYSRKVYRKTHQITQEIRSDTICMRENSFYVDTVRLFRDRRYVFKNHHRDWKIKYDQAMQESGGTNSVAVVAAQGMVVLYESLQLAHKCILNSFYGYVMRKGARWYSMQMAGIVTHTGSNIIKEAREVVEQMGRPLEIDTDGIWCILPSHFPENYTLKSTTGKKVTFSYICEMLNEKVAKSFTNHQYQDYDAETNTYTIRDECSILFECDGPYRCMLIPTSKEKDVKLKKRYAVFNREGRICELKGFEIKRRGELKLIKLFQSEVFKEFLGGDGLDGCYQSVGAVANRWLDILDSHAENYEEKDLIELITESSNMSRKLEEYGTQKSSAISTAKKLAEFLGDDMIKDKGLSCQYIISNKPAGSPITERALPVAIFDADFETRCHYLRRWTKSASGDLDIRELIDWDYYRQRLSGVIQKIITIPAALQNVTNPVPRVIHPDWILKEIRRNEDGRRQTSITSFFESNENDQNNENNENKDDNDDDDDNENLKPIGDIENIFSSRFKDLPAFNPKVTKFKRNKQSSLIDVSSGLIKKSKSSIGEIFTSEQEKQIMETKTPSIDKDFQGWLLISKNKWKIQRLLKKRRGKVGGSGSLFDSDSFRIGSKLINRTSSSLSSSSSFFKSQSDIIKKGFWNIISIEPIYGGEPGIYQMWSLIEDQLIPIKVDINRVFYLNSIDTDPYEDAQKNTNVIPPRGKQRFNVFSVTMSESQFLEQSKELNTLFTNPMIEGVYETKVPLDIKAIIQCGCVATLSRVSPFFTKIVNSNTRFSLEDIVSKPEKQFHYLAEHNFTQLFLYHNSRDGKDGYFVLFNMNTQQCWVIFSNPYAANKIDARVLNSIKEKLPDVSFTMDQKSSMSLARKEIGSLMLEYQRKGPTIILLQVSNPIGILEQIPILREFPRVPVPYHENDSMYSPFNWDVHSLKPLPLRLMDAPKLWVYYANMSRYANIPIGNIPTDNASFMCDILYARSLVEQKHLLWMSDSNFPDLGGSEEDDAKFYEELNNVEINNSDCYNQVCFELDIENLATNTILESVHLAEIEGILGNELGDESNVAMFDNISDKNNKNNNKNGANQTINNDTTSSSSFDKLSITNKFRSAINHQISGCEKEFNILRNLVSKWKLDLVSGSNSKRNEISSRYSNYLLLHFYRWISSTNSKLYDPILYRTLHQLMKKVFIQLIFEFKKLGSKIVYANFNKIIICSQKDSIEDARSYCNYILAVIKKKELFSWINFKQTNYYHNLLWLNNSNYSGILYFNKNNEDDDDDSENEDQEQQQNNNKKLKKIKNGKIISNWNIAEFLPPQIQTSFIIIISDYIYKLHTERDELNRIQKEQQQRYLLKQKVGTSSSSSTSSAAAEATSKDAINEPTKPDLRKSSTWNEDEDEEDISISQQSSTTITKKATSKFELLIDVNRIFTLLDHFQVNQSSLEFPQLPGGYLKLNNPPLEFIKFVCHVLSIDKSIASRVSRLRMKLMTSMKVREFSDEAKFKDPCVSFTLPDVICSSCHSCRDVDLLRNTNATSIPSKLTSTTTKKRNNDSDDSDNDDENDDDVDDETNMIRVPELSCIQCKGHYSKNTIESQLVEIIQRRSLSYQLQDLRCTKCNDVKSDNLGDICSQCSGQWECTQSNNLFSKDLIIFKSIAEYHNFEWLGETVDSLSKFI
ncbi:hypothetical protein ACTFIU_000787 [Dictyostelium citrinum]